MRSARARLIGWGALICLPAALLCIVGGYFLCENVPQISRRQKARQTRECRREAERLASVPGAGEYRAATRPKGWRQAGKLGGGFRWGYVGADSFPGKGDGDRLVWVEPEGGGFLRGAWVDVDSEPDMARFFYITVPTVLAIVVFMTLVGLRFLILFAKGREDFLAAAAHDLTTPLVGLRMTIGRSDDEARLLVERLLRIVENVRDFLRLGGKRPQPARERIDLVECYREAYSLFRDDFRELNGGKDLEISVEGNGSCMAAGDATLTVQILWNLLGNDLKYAAPYGAVSVKIFREKSMSVVEVADLGPGLSSGERKRAFDRYYRARGVLSSGKGGFGIGLCASREIARAMGGDLTVRANDPHGCVFRLALPQS